MRSEEDHVELEQAKELITHVIERHRSEDLRVLALFSAALNDLRVGERYLEAS